MTTPAEQRAAAERVALEVIERFHQRNSDLFKLITDALLTREREARRLALEEAARTASMFSVKPDRELYPGLPWEEMLESAQAAAHSTAQQIACEIHARAKEEGDE